MTTYQRALIRANNGCDEALGAYLCEAFADASSMVGCRAFAIEAEVPYSASWLLSATWDSPDAMHAFISSEHLSQVLSHALRQGWIREIDCNAVQSRAAA
ncbi:hypothetical protein ACIGCM_21495 [Pseudomonas sp. NPDC078700]|uniref:hypothetical protein n=1 Tax=Pseudomonas sp. NPDC078700 TaxID=3364424 RepID=UPI0037C6CAC9